MPFIRRRAAGQPGTTAAAAAGRAGRLGTTTGYSRLARRSGIWWKRWIRWIGRKRRKRRIGRIGRIRWRRVVVAALLTITIALMVVAAAVVVVTTTVACQGLDQMTQLPPGLAPFAHFNPQSLQHPLELRALAGLIVTALGPSAAGAQGINIPPQFRELSLNVFAGRRHVAAPGITWVRRRSCSGWHSGSGIERPHWTMTMAEEEEEEAEARHARPAPVPRAGMASPRARRAAGKHPQDRAETAGMGERAERAERAEREEKAATAHHRRRRIRAHSPWPTGRHRSAGHHRYRPTHSGAARFRGEASPTHSASLRPLPRRSARVRASISHSCPHGKRSSS